MSSSFLWPTLLDFGPCKVQLFMKMFSNYLLKIISHSDSTLLLLTVTRIYFLLTKTSLNHTLTLMSDQHLISPHNITPESHIKVMRIKEMITN